MKMRYRERGFSLLEVLGALAIGVIMTAGLSALVNSSLEETKGQQAAYYQAQVAAAAFKYISTNYGALTTTATDKTPVVINLDTLKTNSLLSDNFGSMNAYGQTPCVLVLKTTKTKPNNVTVSVLNTLVVTEGGTNISDVDIGTIAAQSGQGGGFISQADSTSAHGAYNSWNLSSSTTPQLANFLSKNCSGTAATGGHLASAFFYDGSGPDQIATDYLYRNAFDGHPEMNQMNTPIHMYPGTGAVATEGSTTDPRCASDNDKGKIAVDSNGKILTCQNGTWKSSGSASWAEPGSGTDASGLPQTGNSNGDVRVAQDSGNLYVWTSPNADGSNGQWNQVPFDKNGDLTVPRYILLKGTATRDTPCISPLTGSTIAINDSDGQILTCQNGTWQRQSSIELADNWNGCIRLQASKYAVQDWPPCNDVISPLLVHYNPSLGSYNADLIIQIMPKKNGIISATVSSMINRTLATPPNFYAAQLQLYIELYNNDTGRVIGSSSAMTPILKNESSSISATLLKAVTPNTNGYSIRIVNAWNFLTGQPEVWDEANYFDSNGNTIQQTPLRSSWNFDLFY